jgi:hypothetical protein
MNIDQTKLKTVAGMASDAIVEKQAELDNINTRVMDSDLALKAFALIVLDEINILRSVAGLAPRTPAQLKDAHRAKLDSIS